jgi:N-acetylglucosamine kinase-like BadF-type ATPase
MTYLVGIDSGGTHTNIRIVGPDDQQKTVPEISLSLSSNRSNPELRVVMQDIFAAISGITLGQPSCIWINAAGYSPSSKRRFERLLSEAIDGLDIQVGMSNDAFGLVLAHDAEMVIVVAGTGSVAMARNPAGEVITRGGDEWVVADFGSAFWIGLTGIRAAYSALQGGPETALSQCLIETFRGPRDEDEDRTTMAIVQEIARDLASRGTGTKPSIASFAPQVTRQAELGDEEAQRIVRNAAEELANAASRVYREVAAQAEGRVVLPRFLISGSVAYRSPFYLEAFKGSLEQSLFHVRETIEHDIELKHQLNGLSEALTLAKQLSEGRRLPEVDPQHPYSVKSGAP